MATRQKPREGARIITELEYAWNEIRARHPEVPDVVCITGSGVQKRGRSLRRGHHAPDRWRDAESTGRSPELFIAGELLEAGGEAVLQTMLHEAAHALGHVRGIRNTSGDGNRWHNRKFAQLARELGLEPPKRAAPTMGFSDCNITPATSAAYHLVVRRLEAAKLPFLPDPLGTGAEGAGAGVEPPTTRRDGSRRTGGRRTGVECACDPPRRMQVTPKMLQEGPVLCGLCRQEFTEPEPAAVAGES